MKLSRNSVSLLWLSVSVALSACGQTTSQNLPFEQSAAKDDEQFNGSSVLFSGYRVDEQGWANAGGGSEIWLINTSGRNLKSLTNNFENDFDPMWSPDRTRVAFIRYDQNGQPQLWMMNVDGTNAHVLTTRMTSSDGWPSYSWSPDGNVIAVSGIRTGDEVAGEESGGTILITVENGQTTVLPDSTSDDAWPVFSPDGKQLAFARLSNGRAELWTVNSDGTNISRLTSELHVKEPPQWTPDGKNLIVISDGSGTSSGILSVPRDGSRPSLLVPGLVSSAVISHNGERIAYWTWNDSLEPELWVFNFDRANRFLVAAPARSANEDNLTNPGEITWSPDSTSLVFTYTTESRNSPEYSPIAIYSHMSLVRVGSGVGAARVVLEDNDQVAGFTRVSWTSR